MPASGGERYRDALASPARRFPVPRNAGRNAFGTATLLSWEGIDDAIRCSTMMGFRIDGVWHPHHAGLVVLVVLAGHAIHIRTRTSVGVRA
jgi:hypothetical protein